MESKEDALARVRARHPKAIPDSFEFHGTRDFLGGKLYEVRFMHKGDKEEDYDYVYYDEINYPSAPRVLAFLEDAINLVSDTSLRNKINPPAVRFQYHLLQNVNTTAIIALVFVLLISYLNYSSKETNPKLWEILLLIVGFYFGSKAGEKKQ